MKIILAEELGMCFGVRDALDIIRNVEDPTEVTIHGELVHNEVVNNGLSRRGFRMVAESGRGTSPETPAILVTAHGVSESEKRRFRRAGKRILDTTCPLVRRVHQAARRLQALRYHVVVIGRRGHVEVEGIVGDLRSYEIVERVEEVHTWAHERIGVVCQTTSPPAEVARIRAAIEARNPGAEIRFLDTVCQPTKDRQKALEDLLPRVDGMVVVGGKNSNNTRKLVGHCQEAGVPAHHVQGPADLRDEWFRPGATVGLTAGTSTLDSTVAAVHRRLLRMAETARKGTPTRRPGARERPCEESPHLSDCRHER